MIRFRFERRICRLISLTILVAIAAVLVSPAVPSAPTLMPVGTVLLLGLMLVCSHAVLRAWGPLPARLLATGSLTFSDSLDFVSPGLPLRR